MIKVALDAMGGDHAPGEIISGAVSALRQVEDLHLAIIGRSDLIKAHLETLSYPRDRLSVKHTDDTIAADDDPGLSIRGKTKSSMVVALKMVRAGAADAVLSAGNTGALMAGGVLFLGRLGGISRPALLTPMPSFGDKPVLFVDVGANMDARPAQLLQYAHMGRIYAQKMLGNSEPVTALLNVGAEPNKGNQQARRAHELLTGHLPGFYGNIEGTEVFYGVADIIVCDGFVGNILLKITEGLSRAILGYFRQEIPGRLRYKAGAAMLNPVFNGLKEKVDDSGYGGAPLLGVKGLLIKCHGSSKSRSIEQALLKQVCPFVRKNVIASLEQALRELPPVVESNNDCS